MDSKEVFAQRLIDLRERHNLTQQTLADELKTTRQSLSLYEKAERTINIDMLVKIAVYFNVSTDYLLGLSEISNSDIEMRNVCNYTGLSEDVAYLLNLLNQVKQLNIQDQQPAYIDIINTAFEELNEHYPECLDTLRSAVNVPVHTNNKYFSLKYEFSTKSETVAVVSVSEYRAFLIQNCNEQVAALTKEVVYKMSDNDTRPIKKRWLVDYTLAELCEKIIQEHKIQGGFDNGNNNPPTE